jgi:glutaredoxin-related protein
MSVTKCTFTSLINIWNSVNRFLNVHAVMQQFSDIRTNRQLLSNIRTVPQRFVDICTDLEQFLKILAVPQQLVNMRTDIQRFFNILTVPQTCLDTRTDLEQFLKIPAVPQRFVKVRTDVQQLCFQTSNVQQRFMEHTCRSAAIFWHLSDDRDCLTYVPLHCDIWTYVTMYSDFWTRYRSTVSAVWHTLPFVAYDVSYDTGQSIINTYHYTKLERTFEFIGCSLPCKMGRLDVICVYFYEIK